MSNINLPQNSVILASSLEASNDDMIINTVNELYSDGISLYFINPDFYNNATIEIAIYSLIDNSLIYSNQFEVSPQSALIVNNLANIAMTQIMTSSRNNQVEFVVVYNNEFNQYESNSVTVVPIESLISQSDINTITTQQATDEANIGALSAEVSNLSDINTNTNEVNALSGQQSTDEQNISEITTDVSAIQTEIAAAQNSVTDVANQEETTDTDVSQLEADLTNVSTNVNSISSQQQANETIITNLSNNIDTLDKAVGTEIQDVDVILNQQNIDNSNIAMLSSAVSQLSAAINGISNPVVSEVASMSGVTSGNIAYTMPDTGSAKKFVAYLNNYVNNTVESESITFPGTFIYPPVITVNTTGLIAEVNQTSLTILTPDNANSYSGLIIIEGI